MKKAFLSFCAVAFAALALTSCLGGDGKSEWTGTREFAVIKQSATTFEKQAWTASSLVLTGGDIDYYSVGDAVLVSYKVDLGNVAETNVLRVDYANINTDDVFRASTHKPINFVKNDANLAVIKKETSFKQFGNPFGSPNQFFSDKWFFSFSTMKKKGEVIVPAFYYDSERQKQYDKSGNASNLPENTIVLDVTYTRIGAPDTGATEVETVEYGVVDFSRLRTENPLAITPTAQGASMKIWLRFPKLATSTTADPEFSYLQGDATSLLYYTGQ